MPINILMPALSPTMEKGNLAKWLKKEGDKVKSGDVIAEIETDKATMEVEAVDEGTLAKIVVPEGTADVPVNQLIAVLAGEGEDVKIAAASGAARRSRCAGCETGSGRTGGGNKACTRGGGATTTDCRSDVSRRRVSARARQRPCARLRVAAGAPAGARCRHRYLRASRAAGRMAASSRATSSRRNRAARCARLSARPLQAPRCRSSRWRTTRSATLYQPGTYDVVPHDNIRKTIARRLVEAKLTIPHFYLTVTCNIDRLMAAREDINMVAPKGADGKPTWKLSVNDFVIKALGLALKKIPDANVTWTEGGMLKHHNADVGVAVSIPGGLDHASHT